MAGTATALCAAMAAVGCAGGDGGSSGLSRDQLIERGDTVCADGQARFRTIQAEPPRSGKEAQRQTARLIASFREEIDALGELEPPAEMRPSMDAYLRAREEAIPVLEKAAAAAGRNQPQQYADANEELRRGQPRRYDLAKKVGFRICSRLPDPGDAADTASG